LLKPPVSDTLLPLEQIVTTTLPRIDPNFARIEFDASPWGGGAILFRDQILVEYLELSWSKQLAHKLNLKIGDSGGQSCWEFVTLYLCLLVWGARFSKEGLAIAGDNTAALANAISFRGRGGLHRISLEISWRKVRYAWRYQVAHLPSEGNTIADALSRTSAPEGSERNPFPHQELMGAAKQEVTVDASLWVCS